MRKFHSEADKKIYDLYNQAAELASVEVERLAREVLRKNPRKVNEFCMAMGSYSFSNTKSDILWDHELKPLKGFNELDTFISEWNSTLKITGDPMRFTADGPKITDW